MAALNNSSGISTAFAEVSSVGLEEQLQGSFESNKETDSDAFAAVRVLARSGLWNMAGARRSARLNTA